MDSARAAMASRWPAPSRDASTAAGRKAGSSSVRSSTDRIKCGFTRRELQPEGDARKMLKSVRLSFWVALLGVTTLRAGSPLALTVVQGHSMEPTLRPGALSLLDRS